MFGKVLLLCFISIDVCLSTPFEKSSISIEVSNCPPGYFCVVDDRTRSITPQKCPLGTYSGGAASACTPCPSGHWNNRHGSAYCDICPIGHKCADASLTPEPCPLGTANPMLGQTTCFPCNAGEYTPKLQSPSCSKCPHGHSCTEPSEQPKQCPPGKNILIIKSILN
jgi:hypothetical protein